MLNAKSTAKTRLEYLPLRPKALISFWEMVSVNGIKLWAILFSLESFYNAAREKMHSVGPGSVFDEDIKAQLARSLGQLKEFCYALDLKQALSRLNQLELELIGSRLNAEVATQLHGLRMSIIEEASDRKFAFIPQDKILFFEQEALFGVEVNRSFPSAAAEIKDAGNCIAAELYTAAVFHLMRTSEWGLRSLARHVKARIKGHLAYADWGTVLRRIDEKLTALERKPRGKKKSDELEFYRLTESELNTLKDVWRNNVMHTRGRYSQPEAVGVFLRVREFMQRLASRVKEV